MNLTITRSLAIPALFAAVMPWVTGCANVAYRPLVEQIMGRSPSGLAEADIERYFEQLRFAQLELQLPGRVPSRFVLLSRDGNSETWIDAAGVIVIRENVFHFSSRGLSDFSGELIYHDADVAPQLGALLNGSVNAVTRSRFIRVGDTLHEQILTYRHKATSVMDIAGLSASVHVIEEEVRDTGRGQWVNEHWLLVDGLYNVRSVVRMTQDQKPSVIVVRKLPAVAAQ
jgi:hypothetical protein